MSTEHRAAISMNNTGVLLMDRGCYQQAFDTFSNALLAMNLVYLKQNNQFISAATINAILQGTSRHISRPAPSPQRINCQVLNDSQNPAQLHSQTVQHDALPAYQVLRIESVNFEKPSNIRRVLHTAILLHNLGLSCRIMCHHSFDVMTRYQLQVEAFRMFHRGYSLLTTKCRGVDDEADMQCLLLTATISLQSLIELCHELDLHGDGREYSLRLQTLRKSTHGIKSAWAGEEIAAAAA